MKPRWSDKLTRPVRDMREDITLRTRHDARLYMAELPEHRAIETQWQIATKLLLDGAGAEVLTTAIELALMYEARLDMKMASEQN